MSATSTEWGVFNDEGLVEGDAWSRAEAAQRAETYRDPDDPDGVTVALVCPSCRGGEADDCPCTDDDDLDDLDD